MARKVCQVSFNLNDVYEEKLIEFAATQGGFSRFVKRLISEKMESAIVEKVIIKEVVKEVEVSKSEVVKSPTKVKGNIIQEEVSDENDVDFGTLI